MAYDMRSKTILLYSIDILYRLISIILPTIADFIMSLNLADFIMSLNLAEVISIQTSGGES